MSKNDRLITAALLGGLAVITASLAAIWLPLGGLFVGGCLIAVGWIGIMTSPD